MRSRLVVIGAAAAALLLVASACSLVGGAKSRSEVRAFLLPPVRVDLFSTPLQLKGDYTYPGDTVAQTLRFATVSKPGEAAWKVHFGSNHYACAGIVLRTPRDLSAARVNGLLVLALVHSPVLADVTVGLVDGDARPPRVVVNVPLARYVLAEGTRFDQHPVPLRDFPATGVAAYPLGPGPRAPLPFDWTDVRELRFTWSNETEVATQPLLLYHVHINRP